MPSSIYKFVTEKRAIETLLTGQLRVTQFAALNDTTEAWPNITWPTEPAKIEELVQHIANLPIPRDYPEKERAVAMECLRQFIPKANNPMFRDMPSRMLQAKFSESFGVICLSKRVDNQLMWAHYANSHRGCALEFEASLFGSPPHEVFYRSDRPQVLFSPNSLSAGVPDFLRIKSLDWAYEEELRYIVALQHTKQLEARDALGFPIHVIDFEPAKLLSITLGVEYDEELFSSEISPLLESIGRVPVYEASFDPQHYRIRRTLLG